MEMDAVRSLDATAWLEGSTEVVSNARLVEEKFFESAVEYAPKHSLKKLLTQGFDCEQIWQQIELQDRPLLSNVKKRTRNMEQPGSGGRDSFGLVEAENGDLERDVSDASEEGDESEREGDEAEEEDEEEAEEDEDDDRSEEDGAGIIEDEFLKVKDMEKFLENAEEEYLREDDDLGNEEDEGSMSEGEGDSDGGEGPKYQDFFVKQRRHESKIGKEIFDHDGIEGSLEANDDEEEDDGEVDGFDNVSEDDDGEADDDEEQTRRTEEALGLNAGQESVEKSSFEKQLEKTQKRIEALEKANMDTNDWTMQGEVTAKKRPKNSALEADLDFEHNARPAPVITEEVTVSIEDIIKRRIVDGQYNDVQRKHKLPDAPPAEKKEIDESKSTKGLGELYEADYMQSAGLAEIPATESEKLKKEATILFKTLCTKLDALAHFHFAPKPVIEDMMVKHDVPALTMEEAAPVFVSEASMLAPEELFKGKGAIKDEKELTQNERKSRRAAKKRKFKAREIAKEQEKRPGEETEPEALPAQARKKQKKSNYVKSAKVFAELDRQKTQPLTKATKAPQQEKANNLKL